MFLENFHKEEIWEFGYKLQHPKQNSKLSSCFLKNILSQKTIKPQYFAHAEKLCEIP